MNDQEPSDIKEKAKTRENRIFQGVWVIMVIGILAVLWNEI